MGQPQHPPDATPIMTPKPSDTHGELADDEWEYEYDATETEDLYFTLDLTRHVADALESKGPNEPEDHEAQEDAAFTTENLDAQTGDATVEDPSSSKSPNAPLGPKLQILDLHTTNPLVKFEEGVYSCYWSTDLGTQLYVAQAGHVAKPRRSGHVLDIIGLSQARLTGKPATFTTKDADLEGDASDHDIEVEDVAEVELETGIPSSADGQPLVIPREDCGSATAVRQASFLERLSLIKLKKGEKDPVPVYAIRTHSEPSNKAELKRQALEADAEHKKNSRTDELGRPIKRRKRLTAAERGIIPDGTPSNAGRKSRVKHFAAAGFREETTAESTSGPSRPQRTRVMTAKAADASQQESLGLEEATPEATPDATPGATPGARSPQAGIGLNSEQLAENGVVK